MANGGERIARTVKQWFARRVVFKEKPARAPRGGALPRLGVDT